MFYLSYVWLCEYLSEHQTRFYSKPQLPTVTRLSVPYCGDLCYEGNGNGCLWKTRDQYEENRVHLGASNS